MRLWTIHPKYLDARGLLALWREGLLAQAVLAGRAKGYSHHPQLARFRRSGTPLACIAAYLEAVQEEAARRGYAFDAGKIARHGPAEPIAATRGQLEFERDHLLAKLGRRDRARFDALGAVRRIAPHPLFRIVPGGVEDWERAAAARPGGRRPDDPQEDRDDARQEDRPRRAR